MHIEKLSEVYLFEPDEEWVEALNATFEPWIRKVTLVNKYLGKNISENSDTINNILQDTSVDFIKIDVEGHELKVLEGAKEYISKYNLQSSRILPSSRQRRR